MNSLAVMIRNQFLHRLKRKPRLRSKRGLLPHTRLTTESLERRDLLTDIVGIRLEVSDLGGAPVSAVEVGDSFYLSAYGQDLRSIPFGERAGIFSSYVDVAFDPSLASVAMRETQTISLTGAGLPEGTFKLIFDGQETVAIGVNATASTIESALLDLPAFSAGEIHVTGGEFGPWTVQFGGQYANQNVPELGVDDSSVLGGLSVSVAQATGIDPANVLDAIGSTTYGPDFTSRERASAATAGLLDEMGAVGSATSTNSPVGLMEKMLFSFQFTAQSGGELTFQSAFASGIGNEINLYGVSASVAEGEIDFGATMLMIGTTTDLGQIDATITTTPTSTDSLGQVANLPVDEAWIHEWQDHWVEIWAQLPGGGANSLSAVQTELEYNSDFFTATEVQAGPAFDGGLSSDIDDALGAVALDAAVTSVQNVGLGQPVLVARVLLESLGSDPGVPVNLSEAEPITAIGEVWTQLVDDSSARFELDNASTVIPTVESPPSTDLYPVLYDLDDSGTIGFGDLSFFSGVFLQDVDVQAPAVAHKSDFDLSGRVDFGDFTLLSANFLRSRAAGDDIIMPSGFPGDFAPATASGSAPASASAMLMAETAPSSASQDFAILEPSGGAMGMRSQRAEPLEVLREDYFEPIIELSSPSTPNANQREADSPYARPGDGTTATSAPTNSLGQNTESDLSLLDDFYADLGS